MDDTRYHSPLASRNASPQMQAIWSPRTKFTTWRKLWLALAEAQHELGLPVTRQQVDELRAHVGDVDLARAAEHEKRLRHDVMAHIHALGEQAPAARPIIHLGATSQFVNCNTEILQTRAALQLVAGKLAAAIHHLGLFAQRFAELPTLAFTHYQPAQPTTVGRRAAQWAHDLALCLGDVEHRLATLRFRGVKGTTGTQASFLELFAGDHDKVEQLDRLVTQKMGLGPDDRYLLTTQTYPRVVDGLVHAALSATAAVAAKCATDLRLLANRKEVEEPFEPEQIGSSAMAYKRNPMRCERICGLARFVIGLTGTPFTLAAEQWFERTLDDSATRRLTLPEPFLALDGVLDLLVNVAAGLVVYEKTVTNNLRAELAFMATENLLMAAVQRGHDRQAVHEVIRRHSQAAAQRVKAEGMPNDLLDRLRAEPVFAGVDFEAELDGRRYVGRAPQQVRQFLDVVVAPLRQRYAPWLTYTPQVSV